MTWGGIAVTSFFISYTVIGFLFYSIFYSRRSVNSEFSYPPALVWGCYAVIRLLPFLLLRGNQGYLTLALLDLPLFLLFSLFLGKFYGSRLKSYGQMHYIFTPFLSLCLGYGKVLLLFLNLILLLIIMLLVRELKHRKYSLFVFYPAWATLQAASILLLYAIREEHQTFRQLASVDSFPVILVLGLFLLEIALTLYVICHRYQMATPRKLLPDPADSGFILGSDSGFFPQIQLEKRDLISILLLTLVAFLLLALLTFF